jgi:hypothetical protein
LSLDPTQLCKHGKALVGGLDLGFNSNDFSRSTSDVLIIVVYIFERLFILWWLRGGSSRDKRQVIAAIAAIVSLWSSTLIEKYVGSRKSKTL